MTAIIFAACIGFPLGYVIGWTVDPEGLFMGIARLLVGAERWEVSLNEFVEKHGAAIRAMKEKQS